MIAGVRESSFLNKIFTGLNILVLMFIFIGGLTRANKDNWHLKPNVIFFCLIRTVCIIVQATIIKNVFDLRKILHG